MTPPTPVEEPTGPWAMRARLLITGALFVMTSYLLVVAVRSLHVAVLPVDMFGRAEGLFNTVFPVFTSAVSYWVGSAGKEKAELRAAMADGRTLKANERADEASQRAEDARATLQDAIVRNPAAFGTK